MEAKAVLDLIRRIRHDFGNDLQVISGYMQLQKYAAVEKYLDGLAEEMAAGRIVFEIANAQLALYLFEQILLASDLGMILRYSKLDVDDESILSKNGEPYNSLQELAKNMEINNDEPEILLSLIQENDGIKMVFRSERLPQNPAIINIKE